MTRILDLFYLASIVGAVGYLIVAGVPALIARRGLWREGDRCPDCGKGVLEHGTAVSITTLWHRRAWLRCDRGPRCGFATRRIAQPVEQGSPSPVILPPQERKAASARHLRIVVH